jgi:hypothetical protein
MQTQSNSQIRTANLSSRIREEDCTLCNLVGLLKQVEMSDEIPQAEVFDDGCRYLTNGQADELHNLLQQILSLADSLLITAGGYCNYASHSYLRGFGFNVTPGETSGTGWLTGCIHTKKGIVVYG